jgi:hypothetical protein
MRKWAVLAGLVALAGCAAQRQAQFNKDAAQCRAEIPAVVGNYVRRNQCIIDSSDRAGFTGPSQGLLNATRMELAEKVDKGEMTDAEANAQYAQVRYQVEQSDAAQRTANAQAAAAILSSMPRPQPYVTPTYQMPVPQPWSATCTRMGVYTTCNGN